MRRFILLLAVFLSYDSLAATPFPHPDSIPVISIDDPAVDRLAISDKALHFIDPRGQATIECLVNETCVDGLEPIKRQDIKRIEPEAAYWSVMRIKNNTDRVINKFLALGNVDTIEVYRFLGGKYFKAISGGKLRFKDRAWYSTGSVIPLYLEPGAEYLFYMRHKKQEAIQSPYFLAKFLFDAPDSLKRARFSSFIFGIQVVLVILGLLMTVIFKQLRYLYFVLPIIGFLVWFSDATGHFHLLFNTSPTFRSEMNALFSGWFMPTTVIIFFLSYLKLKQRSRGLYWLFVGLIAGMFIASMARFAMDSSNVNVVNTLVLIGVLAGIGTSVFYSIKGVREAKIFLLFTAPLFASATLFLLANLSWQIKLPGLDTQTLMQIATLISSFILTYVVYEKVSDSIRENIALLRENKRLITEQNLILERKVVERTRELEQEKNKSENLLLNILPKETADELIKNGKAEPKSYEQVTVLFLDFVRFTSIAEKLSPTELVGKIDALFGKFDEVVTKYKIEKIKTIGDAYLCAGGLPQPSKTHALDVVRAGMEMLDILEQDKMQNSHLGLPAFEARVGVHTGSVVAGVVGIKKFAYDIWGDTVNIAARMESNSTTGKLNISHSTYTMVKGHFRCTYRGKVDAKNKGLVDMYYVESARVEQVRENEL